jgi:prophage regulatory protein
MQKRYSRTKHVLARYPISRTTLWRQVRAGKFPAPIPVSQNISVWDDAELDAYDERLKAARRGYGGDDDGA